MDRPRNSALSRVAGERHAGACSVPAVAVPTPSRIPLGPGGTPATYTGSAAGDGRCPGVQDQRLGQPQSDQPLRTVSRRGWSDAAVRPAGRRQPRLRSRQYGGHAFLAAGLAHGPEGRRRPQLLARQQRGLRRHPDDLDLELGGRHRRRRQRRRARAAGDQRPGREQELPGGSGALPDAPSIRSSSSTASAATRRRRRPRSRRTSPPNDITEAYGAAKTKINLDQPALSRLVVRLRSEFHNCWSDCAANANTMQAAIQAFANQVPVDAGRLVAGAVEGAQSL